MRETVKIGIIILIILIFLIIAAEIYLTFFTTDCGTLFFDFCIMKYTNEFDKTNDPKKIIEILSSINNVSPYIYRQVIFMSLIQTLIMVNFFYIGISKFEVNSFFYIFFTTFLCNILSFSFINYHYYQQKQNIIQYGLNKLNEININI